MARFHAFVPMAGARFSAPGIGRWWVDDSGRLHLHDNTPLMRTESRVAFSHYGMVFLLIGRRTAIVRWNVASVAEGSIVGAARALVQLDPTIDVTLEFYWGGWRREPGYNVAGAFRRMSDLEPFRDVNPFTGSALVSRPISAAMNEEGDLISKVFKAWDLADGDLAARDFGGLLPYYLTFRPNQHETGLDFGHVGNASAAISVWGKEWAKDAPGRACHRSQPDFEFDDRVCETYYEVMETGKPQLEHIRALIHRENTEPSWLSYRRLVVRARDNLGVPTVVSVCDLSNELSVPFMAA